MRRNYWLDIYKLRLELISLLHKYNLQFIELPEHPINTSLSKVECNGSIVLICGDAAFPKLPTAICTPLGSLVFVKSKTSFFGDISDDNINAFIDKATILYGLVPILHDDCLHSYAVTELYWRSKDSVPIPMPTFTAHVPENRYRSIYSKAQRVYYEYLKHKDNNI